MPDRKDDLKKARANARSADAPPAAAPKPEKAAKAKKEKAPIRWIETDPPILPDDCPVLCLGRDLRKYAFIDSNGQFLKVEVNQLSADGLADVFAAPASFRWLWANFRKFNKEGLQIGWDKERAKIAVMMKCAEAGPFNFEERVRGEGAWSDAEGRLHWHLGDQLLVSAAGEPIRYESSPLVHGYVYPRATKQPRPADERDDGELMATLLALLKRWAWSRDPDLDARMMLGWIGCAMIGGALDWRPTMWLRGPRGSGKTTLQELIYMLLGGAGSVIRSSDASSAGVLAALAGRSIAVLLDEQEPKAGDNRHMDNMVALARASSSESHTLRSSANFESVNRTMRSCVGFASINVPGGLKAADRTRIIMLRIQPLAQGSVDLDLRGRAAEIADMGRMIRRILVDCWSVWPRVLGTWRQHFMGELQLEARVADTWGSDLAMADLLLNAGARLAGDDVSAGDLKKWSTPIGDEVRDMLRDQGTEHDRVLAHLMTSQIQAWSRGQMWPFQTIMAVASGWGLPADVQSAIPQEMTKDRAQSVLVANGFKVIKATQPHKDGEPANKELIYLACHDNHREARKLFEDTEWKDNGHLQQLEQIPGAYWSRQRFAAGKRDPCVMVPLLYLLEEKRAPKILPPVPPSTSTSNDQAPPAPEEGDPGPTMVLE